ncbi:MAG: TIGR00341 family protein [Thermoplasmatota archaeon]
MGLRLLQVCYPYDPDTKIEELLDDLTVIDVRKEKIDGEEWFARIILPDTEAESALEILEDAYSRYDHFRVVILKVEATLPRPNLEEKEEKGEETAEEKAERTRISVEEIYQSTAEAARISPVYVVLVMLASIVAAIGLLYDNVAVIIGSMVIAPLLSPNMALALATTLADSKLARESLFSGVSGYLLALAVGVLFGLLASMIPGLSIDPTAAEIASRVNINLMYVLLAFSAGVAGSLSVTKGVAQALVGVMVAVALLPPIVAGGLLLGSRLWADAVGALLLFGVNVVCINLAGVTTFLAQGINPRSWWEQKKARRTTMTALLIWLTVLAVLVAFILFYEGII